MIIERFAAMPVPPEIRAKFARELNPEQTEAVLHINGPLLILAGAGSGKTRVITYRIAELIRRGVPPRKILAVTFTNKAAKEMRDRVAEHAGPRAITGGMPAGTTPAGVNVRTFHSLCLSLLREDAERLGYKPGFAVYDYADQLRVMKAVLTELDLAGESPKDILEKISFWKNQISYSGKMTTESMPATFDSATAEAFKAYQRRLKANNAMDFDDLLVNTLRLMTIFADLRRGYQERFVYILVDEFQDTNPVQYAIIRALSDLFRNICVVGDDDQSIYQWRGATIGNILNFEVDYPNAKIIKLERNYRSTSKILDAATAVVRQNLGRKEKTLWTENGPGEKVRFYQAWDERGEAEYVASSIRKLVTERGTNYSDIGVLYRVNSQSRAIEEALNIGRVPYRVFGGQKFYDRKEIKDIVAYLRLIANPYDTVSFHRIVNIPPRGIGPATIEKIDNYTKQHGISHLDTMWRISGCEIEPDANSEKKTGPEQTSLSFFMVEAGSQTGKSGRPIHKPKPGEKSTVASELGIGSALAQEICEFITLYHTLGGLAAETTASQVIRTAIELTDYEELLKKENPGEAESRIGNVRELITAAEEFEKIQHDKSIRHFLDASALATDTYEAETENARGAVSLMTMHLAKGLEFDAVFVTGFEQNLIPHSRSITDREIEEERRLCYVGFTRARKFLHITSAYQRMSQGSVFQNEPSPFLINIPDDVISKSDKPVKPAESGNGRSSLTASAPAPARKHSHGYVVGAVVEHERFGRGVVHKIEGEGETLRLTVGFNSAGQKKLMAKMANLKLIK